tara:strand:+ start:657 stop:1106 length:450 start_codon:yes stop_codon:yes gene_type:complete
MKNKVIILFLLGIISFSMLFSQNSNSERNISPTVTIRYDDILSGMTPSSTIGILLSIDDTKYSGFDTSSDASELRILVGWKWTILGLGTKKIELNDGSTQTVGMTSFGAKYRVLDGMFTSMEYVRIDDENIEGYEPQPDYIRLSIGVDF